MPRLYDLQGNPLTWEELHRRREAYYAQFVPEVLPPKLDLVVSWRCYRNNHKDCGGIRLKDGMHACECGCHGFVKASA